MTCRPSSVVTHRHDTKVCVTAVPAYMPHETSGDKHWFSYRITIANDGDVPVRLLARYWRITDGDSKVREVSGEGVVGEQPVIDCGEEYQYTSYVDFETPVGYMEGSYAMETEDGREFTAAVAMFVLSLPQAIH